MLKQLWQQRKENDSKKRMHYGFMGGTEEVRQCMTMDEKRKSEEKN